MPDILQEICKQKKLHVEQQKQARPLGTVKESITKQLPPRPFFQALLDAKEQQGYGIIAEIKKASPSQGLIRKDFNPEAIAQAYQSAGASCLSILTDEPYFQGRDSYINQVKEVVDLPALRKDFIIDSYQIYESRALGADCILLIMACLSDEEATTFEATAMELGMDVLVEVHDKEELVRTKTLHSSLIGINNRNLKNMQVSIDTTVELIQHVAPEKYIISESGIATHEDITYLIEQGADGFLVGTSLMKQPDIATALNTLRGKT